MINKSSVTTGITTCAKKLRVQALDKDTQCRAMGLLTEKQMPRRQLARIKGLSKGVVERWAQNGKRDK
jgi:hypothetical protein